MVQFLYLIANSNQEANRQISVSFLNILFAKADLNLQHLQQIYNQFEKTPPPPHPSKTTTIQQPLSETDGEKCQWNPST